jgi:N-dimethylarginine dimethylaminohydrolase
MTRLDVARGTPVLAEHGRLTRVLVKHAREAFVNDEVIASQWKRLNFSAPPHFSRALHEYDRFLEILESAGADIVRLPHDATLTLDSIYTRDASIVSPNGVILASMGKPSRAAEPSAQGEELRRYGSRVAGAIDPPGRLEGGDLVWLDDKTIAAGQGARTNPEGIRQLTALLDGYFDELIAVPLPDVAGPHDVMHLMSLISPVDRDLAVVYSRLLPKPFRQTLLDCGYTLVDVPDEEYETMGTNVLALSPRECVMLDGNPKTRAALEKAGANVHVYEGQEISLKGGGGPTCLTRPLTRVG